MDYKEQNIKQAFYLSGVELGDNVVAGNSYAHHVLGFHFYVSDEIIHQPDGLAKSERRKVVESAMKIQKTRERLVPHCCIDHIFKILDNSHKYKIKCLPNLCSRAAIHLRRSVFHTPEEVQVPSDG